VTPFFFYLTRQGENAPAEAAGTVAVKADADVPPADIKP
jgi:hypothetical protein